MRISITLYSYFSVIYNKKRIFYQISIHQPSLPAMSRKKAKNKLKNNNNVKGKNKPKTTTNLAQNSEFNVINSQTNNKKCPRPSLTPTNSEITQLIAQKISIIRKKTKVWIQRETKNVLESIETTKKRLVKEILCSTKSICTKIIETIDLTLDPAKISNSKCNSIAAIQDHEVSDKTSFILPLSQSSPIRKCNQTSIIRHDQQSQAKNQSSLSQLLETSPKVSKSILTLFQNGPKTMKSRFKQQPLQQLMSMDVNPTEQLRQILNEKNIIKIKYHYETDEDEDEEMEDSSSHETFMYAYDRMMEEKKELADSISATEELTGKENVLENKTMYYSSLKEPTASLTDELRTNGQNNTQRDEKISIQPPCANESICDNG